MAVKNIPSLQLHHGKPTAVTVILDAHCILSVLLFKPTFPFGHPSCLEVAAQGAHPFSEPPLPRHPKEEPLAPGASHLPDPAGSRFVQAEIWCQEHREIRPELRRTKRGCGRSAGAGALVQALSWPLCFCSPAAKWGQLQLLRAQQLILESD